MFASSLARFIRQATRLIVLAAIVSSPMAAAAGTQNAFEVVCQYKNLTGAFESRALGNNESGQSVAYPLVADFSSDHNAYVVASDQFTAIEEGCLSMPGILGLVLDGIFINNVATNSGYFPMGFDASVDHAQVAGSLEDLETILAKNNTDATSSFWKKGAIAGAVAAAALVAYLGYSYWKSPSLGLGGGQIANGSDGEGHHDDEAESAPAQAAPVQVAREQSQLAAESLAGASVLGMMVARLEDKKDSEKSDDIAEERRADSEAKPSQEKAGTLVRRDEAGTLTETLQQGKTVHISFDKAIEVVSYLTAKGVLPALEQSTLDQLISPAGYQVKLEGGQITWAGINTKGEKFVTVFTDTKTLKSSSLAIESSELNEVALPPVASAESLQVMNGVDPLAHPSRSLGMLGQQPVKSLSVEPDQALAVVEKAQGKRAKISFPQFMSTLNAMTFSMLHPHYNPNAALPKTGVQKLPAKAPMSLAQQFAAQMKPIAPKVSGAPQAQQLAAQVKPAPLPKPVPVPTFKPWRPMPTPPRVPAYVSRYTPQQAYVARGAQVAQQYRPAYQAAAADMRWLSNGNVQKAARFALKLARK